MTQPETAPRVIILAVEDEFLVGLALEEALNAAGFAVVLASSGREAMEHLDEHAKELGALVTDIRLGTGPSGWEVAYHARTLNHELPIVYTSGDSGHTWEAKGVPSSIFIQKPYGSAQVITAISTLINRCG